MSEDLIVRHGAPTLAGLKTASLFTCPYQCRRTFLEGVGRLNRRLRSKGLRVLPLRFSDSKALVYLYRPKKLCADLGDATAKCLLDGLGYDTSDCQKCLVRLARRLREREEFPHEIGLFLGYPPEDVRGFMENRERDCKCVGCWKVYSDEEGAKKKFEQYHKCTRVYCQQWAKKRDIERLAVAG